MANHKAFEAKQTFEQKAGVQFRDGSELNGWVCFDDQKQVRITIPKGRKDIPIGTFSNMAKRLFISTKQLSEFIGRTIKGEELITIIKYNIQKSK